jgi:hypothetical protein
VTSAVYQKWLRFEPSSDFSENGLNKSNVILAGRIRVVEKMKA